jgi:hypothetical protein
MLERNFEVTFYDHGNDTLNHDAGGNVCAMMSVNLAGTDWYHLDRFDFFAATDSMLIGTYYVISKAEFLVLGFQS